MVKKSQEQGGGWRNLLADLAPNLRHHGQRIVAFTGAGMSAESGVPTFRDAHHALWNDFSPEELATPVAWSRAPARVWAWYEWRRAQVSAASPHAGHIALARLGEERFVSIVTQNVDDLHERAGSAIVTHVHGSLFTPRCERCSAPFPIQDLACNVLPERPAATLDPPHCTRCGGAVRPGVVWFGEQMPPEPWAAAESAVRDADLLLVIGTSAVVYPAAYLPAIAFERSIPVVVINPLKTEHSGLVGAVHVPASAAQALPILTNMLFGA